MTTQQTNKLRKIVKSEKPIVLDQELIEKTLGFEDMREFTQTLNNWAVCSDFTYSNEIYDWQKFIKAFLKEKYL